MATRKKYSKEFKLDAVSLVTEQGYTRTEAARSLDINAKMLGRWVKAHQADDAQAFLNYMSPCDYERQLLKMKKVA